MHKLEATNLYKSYKQTEILHGVSVEISTGEVVGLLGPNGAGKTTTFYMVCGLLPCGRGQITLDDKDISRLRLHERAREGIGYLPQESSIFKDLSVEDNLYLAAEIVYKKDRQRQRAVVEELLEKLGVEQIRRRRGANLSGGERRRVEIARALVPNPKFILLDEPFAGVDPIAVIDIQKIISFLKANDLGVLITDHNVREILSICDRAYVLSGGNILASGTAAEITSNSNVVQNYLGKNFRI